MAFEYLDSPWCGVVASVLERQGYNRKLALMLSTGWATAIIRLGKNLAIAGALAKAFQNGRESTADASVVSTLTKERNEARSMVAYYRERRDELLKDLREARQQRDAAYNDSAKRYAEYDRAIDSLELRAASLREEVAQMTSSVTPKNTLDLDDLYAAWDAMEAGFSVFHPDSLKRMVTIINAFPALIAEARAARLSRPEPHLDDEAFTNVWGAIHEYVGAQNDPKGNSMTRWCAALKVNEALNTFLRGAYPDLISERDDLREALRETNAFENSPVFQKLESLASTLLETNKTLSRDDCKAPNTTSVNWAGLAKFFGVTEEEVRKIALK